MEKSNEEIAKLICQYNGQKGTDKQIAKVLKSLPTRDMLINFCTGRIAL